MENFPAEIVHRLTLALEGDDRYVGCRALIPRKVVELVGAVEGQLARVGLEHCT